MNKSELIDIVRDAVEIFRDEGDIVYADFVDHYLQAHPESDEPLQIAITALNEISEGKGRYDMDRLRHAANTIEDMVELAKDALSKIVPSPPKETK